MDVKIKNIKKFYSTKKILDIDSAIFNKGEITGIVGPNGCGKTSLLHILAGLDKEYNGEISYNGKYIDKGIYEKMTLVTQKAYLFKRTVVDNIGYPLKIRGHKSKNIEKLVDKVIKDFQIEDLRDKKGHRLSGGESQKVSLARSMIFKPNLLLLDEPTSNIDSKSMEIMEREILNFNRECKGTIIIVTHNIQQAYRLCHSLITMDEGKIIKHEFF